MLLSTWITFLGLTIFATGSPGPGSILALSSGLYYGRKRALFTIAGSLFGLLILFSITLYGLHFIFIARPLIFKILATVGVIYLFYNGLQWWQQRKIFTMEGNEKQSNGEKTNNGLFREGFFIAISNPKVILFFSVFFTPFISIENSWQTQITILGVTFFVCEFSWQLIYAFVGNKLNQYLNHANHYVLFNKITGAFFIGSACFLALNLWFVID